MRVILLNLWPPMASRLLEKARAVQDPTALGIIRRENEFADPRQTDRAGAHHAGLERHIEVQTRQAIIAKLPSRCADGLDFSMGRWVMIVDRLIVAFGDNLARFGINNHRTDRHFAEVGGLLGEL